MKPRISLRQTLSDHNLLGGALAGDSWKAWRCLLIAAMVEELTNDERAIFTKLTGREREPLRPVEDFVAVVGRRGGKSRALATLIAYISGLAEHSSLVPGERGLVLFHCARYQAGEHRARVLRGELRAEPDLDRIFLVIGDRYDGEFPRERFAMFSIRYEPSAKPKSESRLFGVAQQRAGRVAEA